MSERRFSRDRLPSTGSPVVRQRPAQVLAYRCVAIIRVKRHTSPGERIAADPYVLVHAVYSEGRRKYTTASKTAHAHNTIADIPAAQTSPSKIAMSASLSPQRTPQEWRYARWYAVQATAAMVIA